MSSRGAFAGSGSGAPGGFDPNAHYLAREQYQSSSTLQSAPPSYNAFGVAAFGDNGNDDDDDELDFSALDLGPPPSSASESFLIRQAYSGYHSQDNGGYGAAPPNPGLPPQQQAQYQESARSSYHPQQQPSANGPDLDKIFGPAPSYSELDNPFLSNSSAALYGLAPATTDQALAKPAKKKAGKEMQQQQGSRKYTDLQLEEMNYYMAVCVAITAGSSTNNMLDRMLIARVCLVCLLAPKPKDQKEEGDARQDCMLPSEPRPTSSAFAWWLTDIHYHCCVN
jgi:hypothetical protein